MTIPVVIQCIILHLRVSGSWAPAKGGESEGMPKFCDDVSGLCLQWGTGVLLLGLRAACVVYKGMMIAFEKKRVVDLMALCSGSLAACCALM